MKERGAMMNDSTGKAVSNGVAGWPMATGVTVAAVLLLLGVYHGTFGSMLDIWERSETFAHGYLIFPISAWLIWRRRRVIARIPPHPDYRAGGLLVLGGLGWLLGNIAGALVLEQLALVGMIPALVWLMLGWPVVREILFPLAFLLFSVPMGEFLIPPLMDFTADFTVTMLRFTGIPVFREGTFFSIPSGDWSVVEACSGLRYLIASITLGFLYAYMTYASPWRRLAFMALSMVFPVIANGLRAYMIVMLGHLSGMTLAVGADHLIYGWVFFGFVMLLMFWTGSFWADHGLAAIPARIPDEAPATAPGGWVFGKALGLALAIAVVWPLRAAHVEQSEASANRAVALALPESAGPWRATAAPMTAWEPHYSGQDAAANRAYQDGSDQVEVYVRYYRHQQQGAELISSHNLLIPQGHAVWKLPEERPARVSLAGEPATVLQGRLQSPGQKLLVWRWNRIGQTYTANDYAGKLLEAKDRFLGSPGDGAAIIVATEFKDAPEAAASVLQRFVDAMLPALEQSLNQAAANR